MRVPATGRRWPFPKSGTDEVHRKVELFSVPMAAAVHSQEFDSGVSAESDCDSWPRERVVLLARKALLKNAVQFTQKKR